MKFRPVQANNNNLKHWGPIPQVDAFWKTDGKHNIRRTDYSESYYTYGLEWGEDYIFTYINSRLLVRTHENCNRVTLWLI